MMWRNMVERGKREMTKWRVRFARWITKALPIFLTVNKGILQFREYYIVQVCANREK